MKNRKTAFITLPLTPAKFTTNNPIYISKKGAVVSMSCGGGMGGAHWYEYIIGFDPEEFVKPGLIWVTLYDGSKKMINTANVVSIDPCHIFVVKVLHTNSNFSDNFREMFFVSHGEKIELISDYNHKATPNEFELKPFKTETYLV